MTTVVNLYQESQRLSGFYVPQLEVRIEGAGLPRDVLRDVIQLTYKDGIKEVDSFELTVNNWDTSTNDFKYVGAETSESLAGDTPESRRYRLFEPCNKEVEVRMGYVGDMRVMLTGNFTTMEPNFPSSGGPTLTVRGLNILHQLRCRQYSHFWIDKKESEIAENIATLQDRGQKRFPLPIRTDPAAKDGEAPRAHVAQENQYDIDFLLTLARQRSYVVFVEEAGSDSAERQLYFGPSEGSRISGLRDVAFELEWGKSLVDFKPTLTTANQVGSVTVRGWNRKTRSPIKERVTLDDRRVNINRDLIELVQRCTSSAETGCRREEVVVREPVFTIRQAQVRARALLMERLKEMVKTSGTIIGLPDLRAGRRVRIKGVGSRFSGTYFVTETTHTINDSGYITRFKARREDQEGTGA
jgi:phage protein D